MALKKCWSSTPSASAASCISCATSLWDSSTMVFMISAVLMVTPLQLLWKRDSRMVWRCDSFVKKSCFTSGSVVSE